MFQSIISQKWQIPIQVLLVYSTISSLISILQYMTTLAGYLGISNIFWKKKLHKNVKKKLDTLTYIKIQEIKLMVSLSTQISLK